MKRAAKSYRLNREWHFYAFISPWLIGFLCFTAIPMLFSLYTSFTEWNGVSVPQWTGLANLRFMFRDDSLFWVSVRNTLVYSVFSVPINLAFAFLLAVALNLRLFGSNFFRAVFYLPSVVAGVAVYITWTWLYDPFVGIINTMLSYVGIDGPAWLVQENTAMAALIIMNVTTCGGAMLILLAGLQDIPSDYYEAARLDGAGAWQCLWRITLPLVSPVLFYNLVMGIINSLQIFTQPWIMTEGGPMYSTYVYGIHLYNTAFRYFNFSYASALAWVLFVIIMGISLLVFKTSRYWVFTREGDA